MWSHPVAKMVINGVAEKMSNWMF